MKCVTEPDFFGKTFFAQKIVENGQKLAKIAFFRGKFGH